MKEKIQVGSIINDGIYDQKMILFEANIVGLLLPRW